MSFTEISKLHRPIAVFRVVEDMEFYQSTKYESGRTKADLLTLKEGDTFISEAMISRTGGALIFKDNPEYCFDVEVEYIQILAVGEKWTDGNLKITHINDGNDNFINLEKHDKEQVEGFFWNYLI